MQTSARDDRPTDRRGERRERCSLRARENDAKISSARSQREKTSRCGNEKKIETNAQTKAYISYLDDGAQTSRGWCNPPGASPDTINRSSRPRLSRANRRCPELRSVTRTPQLISLDMCPCLSSFFPVLIFFLKEKEAPSPSACVRSSLLRCAAPHTLSHTRHGRPSPSLSLYEQQRVILVSALRPFCFMGREGTHNPPKNRGCLSLCKVLVLVPFGLNSDMI